METFLDKAKKSVTEYARAVCSQIQHNTNMSNVGRLCPTLKLSNYETQRKAEYEVFTANVKEVKMTTKIRLKEPTTVLYRSRSKTFIEVQYIGNCSITTDKIIHP
jgi:hypothetical protein